jgi:arabinose-5-phosphate isomerase
MTSAHDWLQSARRTLDIERSALDAIRALEVQLDIHGRTMAEVMSRGGQRISADALATQAAQLMETCRITALPVADASGRLVGALNVHDLMRAGVV